MKTAESFDLWVNAATEGFVHWVQQWCPSSDLTSGTVRVKGMLRLGFLKTAPGLAKFKYPQSEAYKIVNNPITLEWMNEWIQPTVLKLWSTCLNVKHESVHDSLFNFIHVSYINMKHEHEVDDGFNQYLITDTIRCRVLFLAHTGTYQTATQH